MVITSYVIGLYRMIAIKKLIR